VGPVDCLSCIQEIQACPQYEYSEDREKMELRSGCARCRIPSYSLDEAVFHFLIHTSGESNFRWPSKDRMEAVASPILKLLGKIFRGYDAH
jgi:hypothetical protein